jgi:arsenate reductase (thioredoxin)
MSETASTVVPATPKHVLFVCTGNSARSILAEGLLNHLGRGRFIAHSAGSHPTGVVNPHALVALRSLGLSGDGYRSKNWDEFAQAGAPALDYVFTVCDNAAGEMCPVWPGHPVTAHWGVPDPAAVVGTDAEKARAFMAAAATLKRRIELMLTLPMSSLELMAIQRELRQIGSA